MTNLQGKTAIVTGSTSGIGLGIATELARAGAAVMVNGFGDAPAITRARAQVAAAGDGRVAYSDADVTSAAAVARLVEQTQAELGGVDILVNNAGIQHVAALEQFPLEKWDAVLATNLSSVFYGLRAVLPVLQARGWGRVINIASAHGLVASANKSAYVAAKHGVLGLTKVAALENAGRGITVNAICPGWVLTPLVQAQVDAIAARDQLDNTQATMKLLGEKQPSRQFVTPEQVGQFALFLCSAAAAQITGAALSMDGGWVAQ